MFTRESLKNEKRLGGKLMVRRYIYIYSRALLLYLNLHVKPYNYIYVGKWKPSENENFRFFSKTNSADPRSDTYFNIFRSYTIRSAPILYNTHAVLI